MRCPIPSAFRASSARLARYPALLAGAGLIAVLPVTSQFPSVATTARTTTPAPGASGLGDRLYPDLGNGGYRVVHYDLGLRFSADLNHDVATTTLKARTTQYLSRFDLDLTGNTVDTVTVDGRPARWTHSGSELQIRPPAPLPSGVTFTVRVQVSGAPVNVQQLEKHPVLAYGLLHAGSWIQTTDQPAGAHQFAALADHPAQKAPATISITAPSRLNSIANGDLVSSHRIGASTTRTFSSPQALATELLQIGVGPFTVVHRTGPGGIQLRYALPTSQVKAIEPQLDQTVPTIITFLTAELGPFPDRTYGVYAPPIGGELETQTLTLMAADQLAEPAWGDNGVDTILAHEMAHEYFGDSVSPRTWSDLWLNEGHAVYYQNLWDDAHHGGSLTTSMHELYQQQNTVLRKEGPVALPKLAAFPSGTAPYGDNAYGGGALALYALRQHVGAAIFQSIERTWVQHYRDGTAGTADYISLASRVAGHDLGPFLCSWLYGDRVPAMPGHPDWKPSE